MTLRFARLEFGALSVAALAAVYGIWLAVGLPPLPFGIHVGRSPIETPSVVQLANGPLRAAQPTIHPVTITPGRPGRLQVGTTRKTGTTRSTRSATAPAQERTLPATPAAPAPLKPRSQAVGDSIHTALAPAAPSRTPPLPTTTTATLPAVTIPALPQTPPVPPLPQVPQTPSPPPVTPPATPPLPPVP